MARAPRRARAARPTSGRSGARGARRRAFPYRSSSPAAYVAEHGAGHGRVHLRRGELRRSGPRRVAARGRPAPAREADERAGLGSRAGVGRVRRGGGRAAAAAVARTSRRPVDRGRAPIGWARSRYAPAATRSTSGSRCSTSWPTGSRRWRVVGGRRTVHHGRAFYAVAFELYRRHGLADADALRLESARYRSALGHAAALGVDGAAVALAEHRSRLRARPRRRWRVLVPEHTIRLERDGRWSVCGVCRQRVVGPNLRRVRHARRPVRHVLMTAAG